ncbi:branched-chain amino acid ABC transporter permease [Methylocapsa sp. S129]|uniref:branched-chain amino acid ABC transporter permease n=1 Tax=Methylocapsa sp. S129 TaxID=1641869 RepID=UPI00131EBCDD|nr:branched-chain amino acid ABC transporter permease [Methylocapsa sp. S129]
MAMTNAAAPRFAIRTRTPVSTIAAVCCVVLVVVLAALPFFAGRSVMQNMFFILTMLSLAQFWNLLAGYSGLISVGQQAFVGLGAYLLFAWTILGGVDPVLAIVLSGAIAALVALPTSFLVFRLKGAYFAVGTWVVAEVFRLILAQVKILGGGTGTALPKEATNDAAFVQWIVQMTGERAAVARDKADYWLALILAIGAIGLVYGLLRSRRGLALAAIRDNEAASGSVGVDATRMKRLVYVVSAFGAGMTGALIYLAKARISPDAAFSLIDWTAFVFFIVIIGGIATIEGPIVGVLIFWLIQNELSSFGSVYLMLLGALAIIVMLFFPKGVWGTLAERFDLHLFPIRRSLEFASAAGDPKSSPAVEEEISHD